MFFLHTGYYANNVRWKRTRRVCASSERPVVRKPLNQLFWTVGNSIPNRYPSKTVAWWFAKNQKNSTSFSKTPPTVKTIRAYETSGCAIFIVSEQFHRCYVKWIVNKVYLWNTQILPSASRYNSVMKVMNGLLFSLLLHIFV